MQPIIISWDHDWGYLVETLEDGEYEAQDKPYFDGEYNETPNWSLAYELAKERCCRIKFYHKPYKISN